MDKADILNRALSHVTQDRNITHGDAYDQLTNTAKYWSIYLGIEITAEQVAMCIDLMKTSRTQFGKLNMDDFEDKAGYTAIAGECAWRDRGRVTVADVGKPGQVLMQHPDGGMGFVDPPKDAIGDL